jgi:hypothetical protein
MSPSPKSRKISGGIGLPPIMKVRRASLRSDAVDGVSPAEAGGASETTISAHAVQKRKTDLPIFESIEQNHFGRKARRKGGNLKVGQPRSNSLDVAPALLPVRTSEENFRYRKKIPRNSNQVRGGSAALKLQEVERWRLGSGDDRAAGVGLAAVMGLMVEQMQQNIL